jgi:dedicator of cytokinesis protein 3
VVDIHIIEISPMENAIGEVEQKTKELLTLEFKYSTLSKTGQSVSTNALTMTLNGAVDNPSTLQYKENFLDTNYIRMYPERAVHFQKFHQALLEQVCADEKMFSFSDSLQVRVIDSCLKLHSDLCPQEMLPFHEAMERMFRKNFQDEIHHIQTEDTGDLDTGTLQDGQSIRKSFSSHYQTSLHNAAGARRKAAQVVKTQRSPYVIPPLQLGRTDLDPSPISPVPPRSSRSNSTISVPRAPGSKQTPLQKHLAQLARYGMNAVSSGPGDRSITGNSDTQSDGGSPRNSINASEPALGTVVSGVSLVASHNGSVNSHQLRGRFSRFGSGFNFGRKDGIGQ